MVDMLGARATALTAFLVVASACSGSDAPAGGGSPGDAAASGGALGPSSPGVALAHESNALIKENYELHCALCPPCGKFLDVGPQGDACAGIALDAFPDSKISFFCELEAERHYGDCLRRATDCASATACESSKTAEAAKCPVFTGDAGGFMLPAECTQ